MEIFAKPAVGAIIEKNINGVLYILIQERYKADDVSANGLIEIPAGKVREYENIFDGLRREVWEETGLKLTEIEGEKETVLCNCNGYTVISFNPFYSSQNLSGGYSIMLQTFICKATGELLQQSDESVNIRWISVQNLKILIEENENIFYPMHINALKKYINDKEGK
ncbi:MAG: 8-oxo-dGTP pyrophosphatase MutT (NUDIX family) [Clostridium sp.]|jgi:8-oxo-dGTP pyrophosphatase MutT (NUDIX family)